MTPPAVLLASVTRSLQALCCYLQSWIQVAKLSQHKTGSHLDMALPWSWQLRAVLSPHRPAPTITLS